MIKKILIIVICHKSIKYICFSYMSDNDIVCETYFWKYWDFFVPPLDIFYNLCKSYDKTYLFILSFIRVIIISAILKLYYDNVKINGIVSTLFTGLVIYYVINVIILFLIMFK